VAQDTCQNISASYRFTFRRTFVLRRISLHEFPCRHKLEMANTLAEFLNGFRLPLELEDCRKSFEEIVVPGNLGKTTRAILAMAGNPASVSCDFLLSSRDSQLAQNILNQKQTGVLPGKDPCLGRHYALNYFVNSICSPSIAKRSLGFSRSYFSQHISTAVVSHALPFTRLCEPGIFRCYD
jgi:hypothetical protein